MLQWTGFVDPMHSEAFGRYPSEWKFTPSKGSSKVFHAHQPHSGIFRIDALRNHWGQTDIPVEPIRVGEVRPEPLRRIPELLSEGDLSFAKFNSGYGIPRFVCAEPKVTERYRALFELVLELIEISLQAIDAPGEFAHHRLEFGNILDVSLHPLAFLLDTNGCIHQYGSVGFLKVGRATEQM